MVVQLRAQLHSRTVDAFMYGQEVKLADDLTSACEASQQQQHATLHELTAEITKLRATCSEQRESVMQTTRLVEELKIVVTSGEAALEVERTAAATAKAKYHEQGDVWRAGAERIREERRADAAKKLERFRLWEDTISQWLEDGRNKKLDQIVLTQVRAAVGAGAGARVRLVFDSARYTDRTSKCTRVSVSLSARSTRSSRCSSARGTTRTPPHAAQR